MWRVRNPPIGISFLVNKLALPLVTPMGVPGVWGSLGPNTLRCSLFICIYFSMYGMVPV